MSDGGVLDRGTWAADLALLTAEWERVASSDKSLPLAWSERLAAMRGDMLELQRRGVWASGPHDLMSILNLNRWELAHNAALAWLCTPHAAHGLGSGFLEALIAETGPPLSMEGPVEAHTEVSRARSRADVVVEGQGWTLVIEVKVDASEQPQQAQRLYQDWHEEGDVRLVFLTRRAVLPRTAGPLDREAWTPVSWRRVRDLLRPLVGAAQEGARARPALLEYLRTLDATF